MTLNNAMASSFVEHPIQNPPMAYLERCHTSKMELFQKFFLRKKLTALSIFAKKLAVWWGHSAKVCENATFKQIVRNSA